MDEVHRQADEQMFEAGRQVSSQALKSRLGQQRNVGSSHFSGCFNSFFTQAKRLASPAAKMEIRPSSFELGDLS